MSDQRFDNVTGEDVNYSAVWHVKIVIMNISQSFGKCDDY